MPMHTRSAALVIVACAALLSASSSDVLAGGGSQGTLSADAAVSPQRALLDRYCITCHNDRLSSAGTVPVAFDNVDVDSVSEHPDVWEKAVRKLRAGLMPPAGRPRPDKTTLDGFAGWLELELDAAADQRLDPGRTEAVHRLNRTEYRNAIRDLLALDVDVVELLPADDTSYGFDTIAGALAVSPTLLERYMGAARKVSRLAVAAPALSPTAETFRIESDLPQDDRLEGLPFGTRGGRVIRYNFPEDAEYVITVTSDGRATEPHELEITVDGDRIHLFTLTSPDPGTAPQYMAADAGLEIRIPVLAGPHDVGVAFIKKSDAEVETLRQPFLRPYRGQLSQPRLDSVTITGPFEASGARPIEETPSRRRIFLCQPSGSTVDDDADCARRVLSTLARRAYRRPVTDRDLQILMGFYERGHNDGGFDAGIETALRRLLVSPEFLFRIERDPPDAAPGTAYQITDLELASRLSFFLWSSIPDDELLDVAVRGEFSQPGVLDQQVRRMLADARAHALVNSFAAQWLVLRRIDDWLADQYLFPDFDESLRLAMRRETELFFESIVREDRSVLDLLTADYTFVNERLARHYGIPNVYGSHFRRVSLGMNSPRRGLLGHASILTLTSYPARTSPVVRGKWILENLLGTPPPPPPPNVPDLKENPAGEVLSMRERMVQHRANPVCASCHVVMDPLGLSLENFDAVGRWRDQMEGQTAIDVSAVFPDGTGFEGVNGLRDVLLSRPGQFVTNLTEKLMIYALGRGLGHSDAPAVRTVRRAAVTDDYRFSSIVLGIVNSTQFQMRRSQP